MMDFLFLKTSLLIPLTLVFCSYNVMTNLLDKFGLVVEHSKTEVFYFSRLHGLFNPLSLDLLSLGGPILSPKTLGNT